MEAAAKAELIALLENSGDLALTPSPFIDLRVVKEDTKRLRNTRWQNEWANSGQYFSSKNKTLEHAAQTKIWYPNAQCKADIIRLGRPSLGEAIQFLTGHGWFRRHRVKIDEDYSLCRFCDQDVEDPEHLWSTCEQFNGVRQDIRRLCQEDGSSVSFEHPFIWTVRQLMLFLRDTSMAGLLAGLGAQQTTL